jgi:DNA recombination protein Rad52
MSAFTVEQVAALSSSLIRANVRTREQGGRQVSYIEGWHVIAEANRIFGFDGWSRETLDIKCVAEKEREIGKAKVPGWGVTYIAKVRLLIYVADGHFIREGCGSGHGIDRDLGQAHESAIKEAETDAMKRAFMTLGNQFGLALYDKEQLNVVDESPAKGLFIQECGKTIAAFDDETKLRAWWASPEQKQMRRDFELTDGEVADLLAKIKTRIEEIHAKELK